MYEHIYIHTYVQVDLSSMRKYKNLTKQRMAEKEKELAAAIV